MEYTLTDNNAQHLSRIHRSISLEPLEKKMLESLWNGKSERGEAIRLPNHICFEQSTSAKVFFTVDARYLATKSERIESGCCVCFVASVPPALEQHFVLYTT